MNLPTDYTKLNSTQKKLVRELYIKEQYNNCWACGESLSGDPRQDIMEAKINYRLFPPSFLQNPIHLQHDHDTNMTEGAVHAKCNAVLWEYFGR
jgi:hypothetical protein